MAPGKTNLSAKPMPFSPHGRGGGFMLIDESGRARFFVHVMGTTEGITREENDEIVAQLCKFADHIGIEISERQRRTG